MGVFMTCFDVEKLKEKFIENFGKDGVGVDVIIYGEAYAGKMQAMQHVYGKTPKFIAFDVKLNNKWLTVPHAESVCKNLGIEFVWYEKIKTDLELIDKYKNMPSVQAVRNGCGEEAVGEGIILKTVNLYFDERGERVIAKHKRDEFRETHTKRPVDKEKFLVLHQAKEIADEWVTEMRLEHILGKMPEYDIKSMGHVCEQMVEDVQREAAGEIVFTEQAAKMIKQKTAMLFKEKLKKIVV